MDDIGRIAQTALRHAFGESSRARSCRIVKNGFACTSARIECGGHESPLFLKIEKDIDIPRTQKYQVRRECAANVLCRNKGICVPVVMAADECGSICGTPWILEEFIDGRLISDCEMSPQNRRRLGREYEILLEMLLSIEGDGYGDTFEGGFIGRHEHWIQALSGITSLLLKDCERIRVFDDSSHRIVEQALQRALSEIRCETRPALYHYDLLSGNIFAREADGVYHLGTVIDFGMSMFAPRHIVEYQTRKYTDFQVEALDIRGIYGVGERELAAYELLRLEPLLLMKLLNFNDHQRIIRQYVKQCADFLG